MFERMRARVLVAEDDDPVSEEIVRELKEIGHDQVGEASTGVEAVELVHKLQGCVLGMSRHVSRRWYVANVIREEISRVWATRS